MLGSKFGWFWQLDGSETIMLNCSQSLLLPKIRVPISFFHPYLRVKSRGPAAQAVNNWLQICKFAVGSSNCAFHMRWCSKILLLTQVEQQLNQLQVFIYWISPIFQPGHVLCLFQSFTQKKNTQRRSPWRWSANCSSGEGAEGSSDDRGLSASPVQPQQQPPGEPASPLCKWEVGFAQFLLWMIRLKLKKWANRPSYLTHSWANWI